MNDGPSQDDIDTYGKAPSGDGTPQAAAASPGGSMSDLPVTGSKAADATAAAANGKQQEQGPRYAYETYLTDFERRNPRLPEYALDARQTEQERVQTFMFARWLCAWDPMVTEALPACWPRHPMLYMMMETLRLSHAGKMGTSTIGEWMLSTLYPMTDRIKSYVSEYGLAQPHEHGTDKADDMTYKELMLLDEYRRHTDRLSDREPWNMPCGHAGEDVDPSTAGTDTCVSPA